MGFELIYNSVKTEVKTAPVPVRVGVGDRRDVARKATSGRRGHWGPDELGSREDADRCCKESHHPAEWAAGPPVEHLENDKDTTLTAIRVRVKILQFLFSLQLPLTCKP